MRDVTEALEIFDQLTNEQRRDALNKFLKLKSSHERTPPQESIKRSPSTEQRARSG